MKALVTGGGGFVGKAIIRKLHARGDKIYSVARGTYPELSAMGIHTKQLDLGLANVDTLSQILSEGGIDTIFHVAAKAGVWGSKQSFVSANIDATHRLLKAAQAAKVPRFILTSSPSVTFDGKDAQGLSEAEAKYPEKFSTYYPETKALSEKMVLEANHNHFATCALRPHLVWGPGDPHIFPRIIQRARSRRLVQVGSGQNLVDLTFVEHAAEAHILAADKLSPSSPHAGKAYFISDGQPVNLWSFIGRILQSLDLPPIQRKISAPFAHKLGAVCEGLWKLIRLPGEPPMTRFVAKELASSHWYNISAAKTDFGYTPNIDLDQAFKDTINSFRIPNKNELH